MKHSILRRIPAGAMAVLLGVLAACCCEDEEERPHGGGRNEPVVMDDEPCCDTMRYLVEVSVACPEGWAVPDAGVELVVAAVPEQRLYGYADGNGIAYFDVDCPPDVTLVAYAIADGFAGNAADMGTTPDSTLVQIAVTLRPLR